LPGQETQSRQITGLPGSAFLASNCTFFQTVILHFPQFQKINLEPIPLFVVNLLQSQEVSMVTSLLISFILVLMPYGLAHAADFPGTVQEYEKANKLLASSQHRAALSLYQELLASSPKGISPAVIQARIGDSWFGLSSYQNALDAYRAAIKDQKESARPEIQYWIGFCCLLLGRFGEAEKEFLKIPELYPESGMWVGTAYYWAGRASERMGMAGKAAAYYRKAGGNGKSTQERFAIKKAEAVNGRRTK
jgi:tetratricopeptide (TPR) repeat protein